MSKKNKIFIITFSIIYLLLTIILTLFVFPNKIPFCYSLNGKINFLISKWFMIFVGVIPLVFGLLSLIFSKRNTSFLFLICYILSLFEETLLFICLSVDSNFAIGNPSIIPLSVSIFMPLSVILIILSLKLKNAPFKSKLGINFKVTRETNFIWIQTHLYARNVFFAVSFLLFIVSIIFSAFNLFFIEAMIFVVSISLCFVIVYFYSKSIYDKYIDMKNRKDKLDSKDSQETEQPTQNVNNTKKHKKHKKTMQDINPDKFM